MKERIIASAININGAVIVGKRHDVCIRTAVESGIGEKPIQASVQGFYTNHFRFVDRVEGAKIARECGQLMNKKALKDFLFSEDLR